MADKESIGPEGLERVQDILSLDADAIAGCSQENVTAETDDISSSIASEPLTIGAHGSLQSSTISYEEDLKRGQPCWAVFTKWVIMILLFLAVLASLVVSKLAIVALGTALSNSTQKSLESSEAETTKSSSIFLMLVICLTIPYGVTFIWSFWTSGFSSKRPWPSWKAFLLVSSSFKLLS